MTDICSVYIAEDEPLARESLVDMFSEFLQWRVIGSADNGATALEECLSLRPDLLLTDIRMPRLSGLDLVAGLRSELEHLHVVFITAFDQHAIAAFRLAAVDYLLKPITDDELRSCLARVQTSLQMLRRLDAIESAEKPIDSLIRHQRSRLRQLVVRSVGRIDIVPLREVIAFRATGNYVEVITAGKNFLHRQTMKSLLEQLDPARFLQVHRTAIVAIPHLLAIEKKQGNAVVVLDNQLRFPISHRHEADLERHLATSR